MESTDRIGPDDQLWLVTDPASPRQEPEDLVLGTTLRNLEERIRAGLSLGGNPTLFRDAQQAGYEALGRITALRAALSTPDAERIEIYGPDGKRVFRRDLHR